MIDFAEQCGKSSRNAAKPISKPPCSHEHCTFDITKESTNNRTSSPMRTIRLLGQLPLINADGAIKLENANAVISARIANIAKPGDLH